MFAALVDVLPGARVEHWRAHDGSREVGRIPPAMPGTWDISAESWELARQHNAYLAKGKRK